MSRVPVVRAPHTLRKSEDEEIEALEPPMPSPFVSFRMSYTEISSQAGTTRVTSRSARFEGGKLMTQTFEGELDRSAFEPLVQQAQRQFATHMALLLQPFSWFLPLSRRRSSDTD